MHKKKNNGFAYIEALIAAAIVSFTVAPVLAAFHSAALDQRYAADRYEAAVQAEMALAYTRPGETGSAVTGGFFLSRDVYDFIIDDITDASDLIYNAPPVAPAGAAGWDLSDDIHIYNGPRVLALTGPFPVRGEMRVAAVDVFDKQGRLLARAAQAVR